MSINKTEFSQLAADIKAWGLMLGFQQVSITDADLGQYEQRFMDWIAKGFHGKMRYMEQHGVKRTRPAELVPGTVRIISVRLNYLPPDTSIAAVLKDTNKGYISRYALGRDYHRLMRKRLDELAKKIEAAVGTFGYRSFTDSAPVLEKAIAEKAGIGWIGKHTNIINPKAGSWFFLGEIYTDLPLPIDPPQQKSHCGSCTACIQVCPTQAIVAPYQVDARRCISYLTIELRESIPVEFRRMLGNRIYGCDDCQIVCPWNKFSKFTNETDFHPRHNLHTPELLDLFAWTEKEFLKRTEGSAIRRIGYECWQRNIAIGLGNAPYSEAIIDALRQQLPKSTEMVKEHIEWAITEQLSRAP